MTWKECKNLISSDLKRLTNTKWGGVKYLGLICKLLYGIVFLIHKHNQYLTGIQLAFGTDIKIPTPNGRLTEVTHFNGNIVLIPQYVYHILGNLDYYFTHSKGDFDYGLRAQKKGIKMFQVGEVLGECDLHETLDKWCNPDIPFKQRWKALHLPNGMPPKETFHLEKRHYGLITALFHYCTIYLRCIFPWIWTSLK